jgi:flagellar assembly protein FliH
MSSRVLLPGDRRAVDRFVLRQVHTGGGAGTAPGREPESTAAPAPDWSARLAELESAAERRAREAHAAGQREGETLGRSRAAAETKAAMERLARSLDELGHWRARLRKEAEGDVVKLALAVARRILRRELAMDPDALRGLVLAALEKMQAREIHRARVHPSQAALLKSCLAGLGGGSNVEVLTDGAGEPGAVLFETERGNLDASVETQLQEIERGLADHLRRVP